VFSGSYYRNPLTDEFDRVGCLFRIDTDGSVHVVDEGFRLSNGLGFSPNSATMYYVDSADRRIYRWDYRRRDGSIRNRRVFVQVPPENGFPDGMTVDAQGYVWCAHWFGGCVVRYDPDGKVERRLELPVSQVSSVTFGGPNFDDMFVTSAAKLDSTYLAPPGFEPAKHFIGGPVYHLKPGIQGREEYRAKVSVKKSRNA
jgi:D-xylonolactonase